MTPWAGDTRQQQTSSPVSRCEWSTPINTPEPVGTPNQQARTTTHQTYSRTQVLHKAVWRRRGRGLPQWDREAFSPGPRTSVLLMGRCRATFKSPASQPGELTASASVRKALLCVRAQKTRAPPPRVTATYWCWEHTLQLGPNVPTVKRAFSELGTNHLQRAVAGRSPCVSTHARPVRRRQTHKATNMHVCRPDTAVLALVG